MTLMTTIDTGWRSLIERRESPRVPVQLPVTLRHNGCLLPAQTVNISCGGMCLAASSAEIVIKGPIEIILDLTATERDITLRGEVLRVNGQDSSELAIQFVNRLAEGHSALQKFLKNRS